MQGGWASIEELERRITAWFRVKRGVEPYFLARWCYGGEFAFRQHAALNRERWRGQTVDVVCLGDFLFSLMKIKDLPLREVRLWVLSHAARDCVMRMLGLPAQSIGIIPRYELFPRPAKPLRVPDPHEPISFVFSGRLSVSKNFPFCLDVVSALQTRFAQRARFFVFGKADHYGDVVWGVRGGEIGKLIEDRVRTLPWTEPPRFYGHVDSDAWLRLPLPNPVLLTLSRYYMEDFGVSVAQAQEAGWPMAISDWGGHKDVVGPGVLRISSHHLNEPMETDEIVGARAELVAGEIHEWLLSKKGQGAASPGPAPSSSPMVPIDRDEIAHRVRKLESRFGVPLRHWS
jgi:glycosyltransferase involved in cell wall biosynthesis